MNCVEKYKVKNRKAWEYDKYITVLISVLDYSFSNIVFSIYNLKIQNCNNWIYILKPH